MQAIRIRFLWSPFGVVLNASTEKLVITMYQNEPKVYQEKIVRDLKKMDSPVFKGYQIFHNYIRTHEGLEGKTPADVSGIKIEGQNKWITIIQNAKKKVSTRQLTQRKSESSPHRVNRT